MVGRKKEKKEKIQRTEEESLGWDARMSGVNGKRVSYREKNQILDATFSWNNAGYSVSVCVCGFGTHIQGQTESGRQAETTQEIGHLLLWLSWREAKVQPGSGEPDGGTVSRNRAGIGNKKACV